MEKLKIKSALANLSIFLAVIIIFLVLFELFAIFFLASADVAPRENSGIDKELESSPYCDLVSHGAGFDFLENGKLAFSDRNLDLALENFSKALAQNQDVSQIFEERAKLYFIKGDYNKAISDAENAVRICPKNYRAYAILGDIYISLATDYTLNAQNPVQSMKYANFGVDFYNKAEELKPNSSRSNLCVFAEDNVTDYSLAKNLKTVHIMKQLVYFVGTNSIGIREKREIGKEKQPGLTRVFFLGDSYVFGYGVDYNFTIPFLLEQKLNNFYPSKKFEVINLGVPGFDLVKENAFFDRFSDYSSDLVLIGVNGTDIFSSKAEKFSDCIGVSKSGCLFNYGNRGSVDMQENSFFDRFLGWSRAYSFLNQKTKATSIQAENWKTGREHMKQLTGKIRAKGAVPILVFIPFRELLSDRGTSDQKLALLLEFGNENGLLIVDPSSALLEKSKTEDPYYDIFDTHTNNVGNKVIAEKIVEEFAKIQVNN